MAKITFLTGPVRSGKSRRAVELASNWGDGVVFVATYRPDPGDAEMAERVRRHQAERPGWRTLIAPKAAEAAGEAELGASLFQDGASRGPERELRADEVCSHPDPELTLKATGSGLARRVGKHPELTLRATLGAAEHESAIWEGSPRNASHGSKTQARPAESLAKVLAALQPVPSGVVLDCLTMWLSDRLERSDEAILAEWDAVLAGFLALPCPVVVVGNEVGWCPVPEHPVLRRFRDLAGTLGQRTAAAADAAYLYVAGCPVTLKGGSA